MEGVSKMQRDGCKGSGMGVHSAAMSITTVAMVKLPRAVFEGFTRATAAPSDPSRLRLTREQHTFEVRLLDDGALIYTDAPFSDPVASLDHLWELLGDDLADHDDDRGVFAIPSTARVGASTFDAIAEEIGELGEWLSLDEDNEDDEDEVINDTQEVAGAGPDLMSMMANITNSLGADTIMSLQRAMMSGDAQAMARAQDALTAKLSQQQGLASQLESLMGAMPPGLRDMAMNSSPEQLMQQMRGQVPPDMLAAMEPKNRGNKKS
jgi:hypothetical protein